MPVDALNEVAPPKLGDLIDEAIVTLTDQAVERTGADGSIHPTMVPSGTVAYVASEMRGAGGIYSDTIAVRQTLEGDSGHPLLILNRADLGRTWKFVPDDGATRRIPTPLLRELKQLLDLAYSSKAEQERGAYLEKAYLIVRMALGPNEYTDADDAIPKAIGKRNAIWAATARR